METVVAFQRKMLLKRWGDCVKFPPRTHVRIELDFRRPGTYLNMFEKLKSYFQRCTPRADGTYDPLYDMNEFLKAIELVARLYKLDDQYEV